MGRVSSGEIFGKEEVLGWRDGHWVVLEVVYAN